MLYKSLSLQVIENAGKLGVSYRYEKAKIKKAPHPFAEGSVRLAYFGVGRVSHFFSKIAVCFNRATVVFKTFKHVYERLSGDGREDVLHVVETQAVANHLAKEFNKVKPIDAKPVVFLDVKLIELCGDDGLMSYYTMEDIFPDYNGKFVKYNSNFGFVNHGEFASTLNAFSHWTYEYTQRYLMVVDLQGIQHGCNDQYVLTDPSIHCREPRFGSTNLGEVGMESFFEGHKCNKVCSLMGLKADENMTAAMPT